MVLHICMHVSCNNSYTAKTLPTAHFDVVDNLLPCQL